MKLRPTDVLLVGVVLTLAAFVAGEIALAPRAKRAAPPPPRLANVDTARVARMYAAQIASMSGRYQPAAWIRGVQLARLYDAALTRAPAPHDSAAAAQADSVRSDVLNRARAGTYLPAVIAANHDVVIRWPTRDDPIRVWVQPRSAERGFDAEFPGVVRAALRRWSELGLGVTFGIVDDSTTAEVLITWSAKMPVSDQLGYTFRLADDRAEVILAHVIISTSADVYAVQNSALHEAGHVLGLEHSPDTADIMAATTAGRLFRLTDADRSTARLLYELPAGPLAHH